MISITNMFELISRKHTVGQVINLLKYKFGAKGDVLYFDPIYISFFLTYKCNLSCNMCLTHSNKFINPYGQKPTNDMDLQLFKQVLHKYKNALIISLVGNGEPLLNKDLFQMINYASYNMKMKVSTFTNGVLLGDYIIEVLNSPLEMITISLNGHTPEEFNRMTGMPPAVFHIICGNINDLAKKKCEIKSGVRIRISFILDRNNYRFIQEMIFLAEKLGADQIAFVQFLAVPAEGYTADERCIFADDFEAIETFSRVKELPSKLRNKIELPPLISRDQSNNRYCLSPFYVFSIDGDGNVGCCSCQLLDNKSNGNFYDENDPWNCYAFKKMRRDIRNSKSILPQPCTWCYNNTTPK